MSATWEKILKENQTEAPVTEKVRKILEDLGLTKIDEFAPLKRGMTNQIFVFSSGGSRYLLRLSGAGTKNIINRAHEVEVYGLMNQSHLTEDVLYIDCDGIKVSRYLEGTHPCDCRNKSEVQKCMRMLREFHSRKYKTEHAFDIYAEIRLYEKQCGVCHDAFEDVLDTREKVMSLRGLIRMMEKRSCLCHIDAVHDNFLIREEEIYLIDWEYAGLCDPYIDVAMFCIYAEYTKEEADWVIHEYLGEEDSPEARMLVYAYMSAGAYMWVLWCEVKRANGIDFTEYEKGQYQQAREYYQYAMDLYRGKDKNV